MLALPLVREVHQRLIELGWVGLMHPLEPRTSLLLFAVVLTKRHEIFASSRSRY